MVNNEDNHEIEMGFIPNGDSQPTSEEGERRDNHHRHLDLITRGIRELRRLLQHKLLCVFIVILFIIIGVLGILYGHSRHSTSCPTDWIGYNEKCYHFSKEERNWTSSESFCTQYKASLATINTELQELMAPFKARYIYWIGLRREPGQDWKWTSGEISRMEVIGQNGGDCAYLNDEFKPSTSRCSHEHHWICSKVAMH
ncbi:C-type lectin domain family 2 member B-like [Anolis sagrei]|uniref:C-type lectin domain family 2 member B-like n=1 Tax=Anolis sagrei TaxID=38937 RepID=UPI003520F94E